MTLSLTILLLSLFFVDTHSVIAPLPDQGNAYAQDDWKKEFDDACQVREDSDQLTREELQSIIKRCNALKPRIEKLEDPQRKVMLSRLKRCSEFYSYLLDMKENK
jgi:hypothetical protein